MNPLAARVYALVLLPVAVAIGLFLLVRQDGSRAPAGPSVAIGERVFFVEIADTDATRRLGLGERDSLPDDYAMLFRFDVPGNYGFWMKGMRFPLDIAWIYDGRIVHIERNVPADSRETMHPGSEATMVLETNAGALDGADIGSEVLFYGIDSD
jgi:uncharacterized membrane protein (UPF0127 family)